MEETLQTVLFLVPINVDSVILKGNVKYVNLDTTLKTILVNSVILNVFHAKMIQIYVPNVKKPKEDLKTPLKIANAFQVIMKINPPLNASNVRSPIARNAIKMEIV